MTIASTDLCRFMAVLWDKHRNKGISLENNWGCELPNFPAEIPRCFVKVSVIRVFSLSLFLWYKQAVSAGTVTLFFC
jgi:hypothetical protein